MAKQTARKQNGGGTASTSSKKTVKKSTPTPNNPYTMKLPRNS